MKAFCSGLMSLPRMAWNLVGSRHHMPRRHPARICLAIGMLSTIASASTAAAAQHAGAVSGQVVDARTGAPLQGALVHLENTPTFAETDDQGRFTFTSLGPGTYMLYVSVVGYSLERRPVRLAAGASAEIIVKLSEGAGTYTERVTVTGSAVGEAEEIVPSQMTLHGAELQNLRGLVLDDPLRAIQVLPGVASTDDLYSEFAVRGSPFSQMNLTIDGIPTPYLLHTVQAVSDGGSIAMINSDVLDSATLLHGSYPQRQGRRLGAQLDLMTRSGSRERRHVRAGLSGTSASVLAEGPLASKRGAWLVSARKSYLDFLIRRIDPEAEFGFGFIDAQGRVDYDVSPRQQLQISALVGRSRFANSPDDVGVNSPRAATNRAWLGSVAWRVAPADRVLVTHRVYSTGNRFRNDGPDGSLLDRGHAHDIGYRVDASVQAAPALLLELGGDVVYSREARGRQRAQRAARVTQIDYDDGAWSKALYGRIGWRPSRRFTLAPGVRLDSWGLTNARTASPWVQGEAVLPFALQVRAGGGLYRQFPGFAQVVGPLETAGRNALAAERARHVDVSLERRIGRLRAQVTLYDRQDQGIFRARGAEVRVEAGRIMGASTSARFANALDGYGRGVEVLVQRTNPNGLSGWASYTYGRNRYTDPVTHESFWGDFDQRHALNLYGHYRVSSRTSVSGKLRTSTNFPLAGYVALPAGNEATDPNAPFVLTDVRNTVRLPGYARLDLRANRVFNWQQRRLTLFVEVGNVLNRANYRSGAFRLGADRRVFDPLDKLIPIVPSAGFIVEF